MAEERESKIDSIVSSLRTRLGEQVDATVIAAEVGAELARFSTARVSQYVPILVERRVAQRLWERQTATGELASIR